MTTYIQQQFARVRNLSAANNSDLFNLQIVGLRGHTNWLNINAEQLKAIEEILGVPEAVPGEPVTLLIAANLHHGKTLHHVSVKNADGSPTRCRVTGACKLWKTRPDEFKLLVKYGLRDSFYITEANAKDWVVPA